jgi:hypothetical protein
VLTLQKGKSVMYMSDGKREWLMSIKSRDIALKSSQAWSFFGATAYEDLEPVN